MGCRFSEQTLLEYVYGGLEREEEEEQVRTHVGECADCRAVVEAYSQVRRELDLWSEVDLSPAAEARLLDSLRESMAERREVAHRTERWWVVPLIYAACILVLLPLSSAVTATLTDGWTLAHPSGSATGWEPLIAVSLAGVLVFLIVMPFTFLRRTPHGQA